MMLRVFLLTTLAALATLAEAQPSRTLTLPARVSGALTETSPEIELTASGDVRPADRYRFTLSEGMQATVRMTSEDFDTYLKVFRNGDFHSRNDDYDGSRAVSQLILSRPGEYIVLAGAFSATNNTGTYALSVTTSGTATGSLPEASALDMPVPGTVHGRLTNDTEQVELTAAGALRPADRYTFTLLDGQRVTLRMESTAFDTYLKVFHDGRFHLRNDDYDGSREVSQVVLTRPGTYTVLAGAFRGTNNTGPYELTTILDGATTEPPGSGDGSTIEDTLTDGDTTLPILGAGTARKADTYSVELYEGEVLVVTMESTAFDTYLALSRDNVILTYNDDSGSTQRSQIRYTVPRDGTYFIYAGTYTEEGRGAYTFTWYVE